MLRRGFALLLLALLLSQATLFAADLQTIQYQDVELINFTTTYVPTIQILITKTGTKPITVIDHWEIQVFPLNFDFPKDMPEESKFIRKRVPIYANKTISTFSFTPIIVQEEVKIAVPYIVKVPIEPITEVVK